MKKSIRRIIPICIMIITMIFTMGCSKLRSKNNNPVDEEINIVEDKKEPEVEVEKNDNLIISADGKYSIEIKSDMTEMESTNDGNAIFCYIGRENGGYGIQVDSIGNADFVTDDRLKDILVGILNEMGEEEVKASQLKPVEINGMKGFSGEFITDLNGQKGKFVEIIISDSENVYLLQGFALEDSYNDTKKTIMDVLYSFKKV